MEYKFKEGGQIMPYYVINWNVNKDDIEYYDIMPYLLSCWDEESKRDNKTWFIGSDNEIIDKHKMPTNDVEIKTFVLNNSKYRFWSRCEYEVIVSGWPSSKNNIKIDVYDQIEKNIDVVTKIFKDNLLKTHARYIIKNKK